MRGTSASWRFPLTGWQQRVVLHFGAVDYFSDVWLNGEYVGGHEGGYLPFEFDVTAQAKAGDNLLTVRVSDPPGLFAEIPHGKQSWYGPLSGIWQSVWLQRRAALHVEGVRVHPELASGTVTCQVRLSGAGSPTCSVRAEVTAPDGAVVAVASAPLEEGVIVPTLSLHVEDVQPWSPDHPALYQIHLTLVQEGETVDRYNESFGFRTIEARDGYLYLNGEMIYLRGALDQDYYPGTISTPPSLEFLEDQARKAKELGLNCLRCHIKVPDPRYYEVADRLGLLIWTELPNWRTLTDGAATRAWETMEGIVERDGNHPSIIIWTLVNEDWGTDLMYDPAHRAWLKESYHRLKALDPTRLVVDNSPCVGNFHVESDIEDYHFYRAIPDHGLEWDHFVNTFAARFALTYSPFGDAVRRGDEPLILSEFGNWGLPDVTLLRDAEGQDPWWFESGLEWGNGVVYPHNVEERFRRWGLDRAFESWEHFAAATQWQEFHALKYEIEAMRRRPRIAGYVITEFTDVHWECNGLLDMERHPKAFHETFKQINADTVLIPEWTRLAYWSGESAEFGVTVAHGASPALPGGTLGWSLGTGGASGELSVPMLPPGTSQTVGLIQLEAPSLETPRADTLHLTLGSGEGEPLATSTLPLTFFPRHLPARAAQLSVWVGEPLLASQMQAVGYNVVHDPKQADVAVTHQLGYEHARYVREGGHLLLLANSDEALPYNFLGMTINERQKTLWDGDWASSFAWLLRDGPFAAFPGGPLLDNSYMAVAPNYVISGLGPWDFESNVYAGLFVGWIHKVVALLTRQRYGAGQAVLTTFRIHAGLIGTDPLTTHLLDAMLLLSSTKG